MPLTYEVRRQSDEYVSAVVPLENYRDKSPTSLSDWRRTAHVGGTHRLDIVCPLYFPKLFDTVYILPASRIITKPMDLSTAGIYTAAFRGLRKHPLVYLILLIWTLVITILVTIFATIGTSIYMGSVMVVSMDVNSGSSIFYLTITFIGILLLITSILLAATKAGFMAFGSAIRKDEIPTPLVFFKGILRYTLPLFIGGLVVAMLTCIPFLAFLAMARISLTGVIPDVFTSGWNYRQAVELVHYIWGLGQIAAVLNAIIFFWLAPWDEMVVLYNISYAEAMVRSFKFVFSRRHFHRILLLIIANMILSQVILLLTNLESFTGMIHYGIGPAWLNMMADSSQNMFSTSIQFVLYPFFIYTQLYLLPRPEKVKADVLPERPELHVAAYPPAA